MYLRCSFWKKEPILIIIVIISVHICEVRDACAYFLLLEFFFLNNNESPVGSFSAQLLHTFHFEGSPFDDPFAKYFGALCTFVHCNHLK